MSAVGQLEGVDAVVAHLDAEFGGVDREELRRIVTETFDELARDATVKSFLPVLALRMARHRLLELRPAV